MILILTGAVQSGKSRFLGSLLAGLDRDRTPLSGFLSPAVYEDGRLVGYDLTVIGGGPPAAYIRKEGQAGWERVGPYFFVPEALETARRTILESGPLDLLVVDEVGPLELVGGGLWRPLESILADPGRRCLLVVRASCLEALTGKLAGRPFQVFPVDEPSTRAALLFEISRDARQAGAAAAPRLNSGG